VSREVELEQAVSDAVTNLFQRFDQITFVILYWEEWHQRKDGPLVRLGKYREIVNYGSTFHHPSNIPLLLDYSSTVFSTEWVTLAEVVDGFAG